MTLHFTLTRQDYLNTTLFTAGQDEQLMAARKRSQWVIVLGLVGLGCIFFFWHKPLMAGVLWLSALTGFVLYPQVTARSYKRQFEKLVDNVYAASIDAPLTVTVEADYIAITEGSNENRMDTADISRIFETARYFFIIMKTNNVVTILKTERVGELRDLLKVIAVRHTVPLEVMTGWEWK